MKCPFNKKHVGSAMSICNLLLTTESKNLTEIWLDKMVNDLKFTKVFPTRILCYTGLNNYYCSNFFLVS